MAFLITSGQPSDSTGSTGDVAFDNTNRMIWGPKTTTWAGTAQSTVGPSGPSLVVGSGAPASSVGSIGQGYMDLVTGNTYGPKTSNGWGAVIGTLIGPTGPQGAAILSGAVGGSGPVSYFNGTASATAQIMTLPGTTTNASFVPVSASAFLGASILNGSSTAATVELYDTTASASIFSTSVAANTVISVGLFAATTYPLITQHIYVWRITGSAAASMTVYPQYLFPAAGATTAVSNMGPAGNIAARTWATGVTTATNFLPVLGGPDSAPFCWYVKPNRAGFFYGFSATYIPSGSTANTHQVTLSLAAYKSGSQPTLGSWTLTANSTKTFFGPLSSTTYATDSTYQYYWVVTASTGSGTVIVEPLYVY